MNFLPDDCAHCLYMSDASKPADADKLGETLRQVAVLAQSHADMQHAMGMTQNMTLPRFTESAASTEEDVQLFSTEGDVQLLSQQITAEPGGP